MIPWIQVYSNLLRHPKTTNLADELGLTSSHASPNAVAAGMLVSLWLWAAQNATDGDLSKCSDRAIAEAAEYKKKPAVLVEALIKTGWIDKSRKLHDWEEYAALLHDIETRNKENTRNRVKRYRDRKKLKSADDDSESDTVTGNECNGYGNVTGNECNAPTLPNLTLPNITLPDTKLDTTQKIIGTQVSLPEKEVVRTGGATSGLRFGSRQNVSLTQSEYDRLLLDFGEINVAVAVEAMGKWLEEGGENPENHYALLRRKLRMEPTLPAEDRSS